MASPLLAAIFSFFIPGLGQFYAGHFLRGILVFIMSAVLGGILTFVATIFAITIIIPFVAVLIGLIYWIWNIIDAYKLASQTVFITH
jgi:TM2 domain-containing membrane protein YozV